MTRTANPAPEIHASVVHDDSTFDPVRVLSSGHTACCAVMGYRSLLDVVRSTRYSDPSFA